MYVAKEKLQELGRIDYNFKKTGNKYYYLYKIVNKLNGKYYIGVHSTYDLNDGYMGSGVYISRAIMKHGVKNFEKIILEFFQNSADMYMREAEVVNDALLHDPMCYNLVHGGNQSLIGMDIAIGPNCEIRRMCKQDPRILSNEYIPMRLVCKDGKNIFIPYNNCNNGMMYVYNIQADEYCHITKQEYETHITKYAMYGTDNILVYDADNNVKSISVDDPEIKQYKRCTPGLVTVKDSTGKTMKVAVDDPRYVSGELQHNWKGMVVVYNEHHKAICVPITHPKVVSGEYQRVTKGMCVMRNTQGEITYMSVDDPRRHGGEFKGNTSGMVLVYMRDTHKRTTITINELAFNFEKYVFKWSCKPVTGCVYKFLFGDSPLIDTEYKINGKCKENIVKFNHILQCKLINKNLNIDEFISIFSK